MTETSQQHGAIAMDNAQHHTEGPSTSRVETQYAEVSLGSGSRCLMSGHVTDLPTASDLARLDWTSWVRQDDFRRGLGRTYERRPRPEE